MLENMLDSLKLCGYVSRKFDPALLAESLGINSLARTVTF
jgi:hypothetical protein